jgi:hypothetical protein
MPQLQPMLSDRSRGGLVRSLARPTSLALLFGAIAACVGSAVAASRSQADPANPGAPEVPMASASPLASGSTAAGRAPAASASPDAAVIYTCPMHPQVRSPVPGNCPICGMTLVPVKP